MEKIIDSMENSISNGDIENVKKLLRENKELIYATTFSGSWLHIAVKENKIDIAKYLIEQGIDINLNGGLQGNAAICIAASKGNMDMAKMLIQNNAKLDTSSAIANPLFDAIYNKRFEMVEYLISQGIDISVKYNLSYGEIDAYIYSTMYGTEKIAEYIKQKMKEKGILITESEEKNIRVYDTKHKPNLDELVLKEMFVNEIKQSVSELCEEYKDEEIYAVSYRMYLDAYAPEDRYQCEIMIQTEEGYQEQCEKFGEENLYLKYVPEEYKYAIQGKDLFEKTSDYLFANCLNVEICKELKEEKEQEKMEEAIREENRKIQKIFAETVANLRGEGIFKNKDGKNFYVFPYFSEDDDEKEIVSMAKIMNEGLDLKEYIEYFEQ